MARYHQRNLPHWGNLLEFIDPALESQFLSNYTDSSFKHDVLKHCILLAFGCCFVLVPTFVHGYTLGIHLFALCIGAVLVRLLVLLHYKDFYKRNRTRIGVVSHIGHSFLAIVYCSYIPMPTYTSLSMTPMYIMRSPTMIQFMIGLGVPVPMKVHVFSSAVACLCSSPWVIAFCHRCKSPNAAFPVNTSESFFPSLSTTITQWLHRSTIIGALVDVTELRQPRPAPNPISTCWVPMIFMHIIFGYFLPTLALYLAEAHQRAGFIASKASDSASALPSNLNPDSPNSNLDHQTGRSCKGTSTGKDLEVEVESVDLIWSDFRSTALMAMWICFMMVQVVWILVRCIGEGVESSGLSFAALCPSTDLVTGNCPAEY